MSLVWGGLDIPRVVNMPLKVPSLNYGKVSAINKF